MSVTAATILTQASLWAGLGDQYNPVDGTTTQTHLQLLNDVIDEFIPDAEIIFDVAEYQVPVLATVNNFLLGPANLTITPLMASAPMVIEAVSVYDAQGNSYVCSIIGPREWAGIVYKPATGRPRYVYLEYAWPNATLWVFPTESFTSDVIHVWAGNPLAQFTNVQNVLVMPNGYSMMLQTQLALRLCELHKMEVPPTLNKRAVKSLSRAVAAHKRVHLLSTNIPGGLGDRYRFNIYTGEWQ